MSINNNYEYDSYRGQSKAILKGYKNAHDMLKNAVVACRDLGSQFGYVMGLKDAKMKDF